MREIVEVITGHLASAALDRVALRDARATVSAMMRQANIPFDHLVTVYALKLAVEQAYAGPPSLGIDRDLWTLHYVETALSICVTLLDLIAEDKAAA